MIDVTRAGIFKDGKGKIDETTRTKFGPLAHGLVS